MNHFRRPVAPRRQVQRLAPRRVVQPSRPPSPVMNHDKYEAMTAHSKFKPGDLCWARLDIHRIWPAVIMDPSNAELLKYPLAAEQVLLFVNFLVVDYNAFLPETDIWDYKTGAELFSKTNAARTKSLTEAVNNLKRMSEVPADASIDDANSLQKSNELGQTSEKVDVYEFQDDDLNSEEQITPGHQRFSQAGRKANMAVQDIQSNQLNHLEPKVILARHAEDECAQKDEPVKTNARGELIADNEANEKDEKLKIATKNMNSETIDPKKSVVKQGKQTMAKKNAKQLAEEYVERKTRKLAERKMRREAEEKGEKPVETAEKIVKKRKNQKNVEEQEEKAEKIVKKRKNQKNVEEQEEKAEKIVKKRKNQKNVEEQEEKAEKIVKKRKNQKNVEEQEEKAEKIVKKRKNQKNVEEQEEKAEKIVKKRKNQKNVEEQEEKAEKIVKKKKVEKEVEVPVEKEVEVPVEKEVEVPVEKEVEVPVEKIGKTRKKSKDEQKVECVSEEKSSKRSRSGRALRKTKQFQVLPSVRKPREKKKLSSPRKGAKGKRQIQKRDTEPKSVIPDPESVFSSFRKPTAVEVNNMNPHISLQNMPKSVLAKFQFMEERRMVSDAKFGFVGLGSLGKHLARRMLLSGHRVYLWDRSPWKCYDFIENAKVLFKDSLEELIKECSIIFVCISDGPAVKSVISKNKGLLRLIKGKGVVNFTTMTAKGHGKVKKKVERYGGMYLSVSLIESTDKTTANNYTALVSGNEKLFGECLTCIAAMSNFIYFMDYLSWAQDFAKLSSILTPCFHVNGSSFLDMYKQQNLTSNFRRSYEACIMDLDALDDSDLVRLVDPHLRNYLPPTAISRHLQALLKQVGKAKWAPTITCLNELYMNCKE